jgi:nucleotide-binding universal stress UspA family protein
MGQLGSMNKDADEARMSRWIVVGTDFSEGAQRALEYALELAAVMHAKVACVHAYEDAMGTPALHDPSPDYCRQIREVIAMCSARARDVDVESVVRRGAPWDKLVNVATELGADLIVIGADGQRGASQNGFVGSVASRLVACSSRKVVVVPSSRLRAKALDS